MSATTATPAPRRRLRWWLLVGLSLCLTPLLGLALAVASYLTLDRDARIRRQQVMAATAADWSTIVQLSVGDMTLGAVRSGLWFAHGKQVVEARLALAAVRQASVGVYERKTGTAPWSREQLFINTDRAMHKRGWTRLVGVADQQDTVLVYVPRDLSPDKPVDICIAVVHGQQLVVVSTSVDAAKLAELAARHTPAGVRHHLHRAQFRF